MEVISRPRQEAFRCVMAIIAKMQPEMTKLEGLERINAIKRALRSRDITNALRFVKAKDWKIDEAAGEAVLHKDERTAKLEFVSINGAVVSDECPPGTSLCYGCVELDLWCFSGCCQTCYDVCRTGNWLLERGVSGAGEIEWKYVRVT
jgi:hypothetical protein